MERGQYQRFADVDARHWWFKSRRSITDKLLRGIFPDNKPERQILDIGTGTGGMVPVLGQFGSVTASEPDHETFEFTRGRLAQSQPRAVFVEGTWEALKFPPQRFDLITAFDVLEHCQDDRGALSTWGDWLKEDGTLFITVPAFNCLWGLNDEISHHFRRYEKRSLTAALNESGFRVDKMSYINSAMFLPVWVSRNVKERLDRMVAKERDLTPWDFSMPPAPVNALLEGIFSWERNILPHSELPWGTSLLAVARKAHGR